MACLVSMTMAGVALWMLESESHTLDLGSTSAIVRTGRFSSQEELKSKTQCAVIKDP